MHGLWAFISVDCIFTVFKQKVPVVLPCLNRNIVSKMASVLLDFDLLTVWKTGWYLITSPGGRSFLRALCHTLAGWHRPCAAVLVQSEFCLDVSFKQGSGNPFCYCLLWGGCCPLQCLFLRALWTNKWKGTIVFSCGSFRSPRLKSHISRAA